jgi:putative FmdB family regulatory protein
MPIYEYACSNCGFQKDILQKINEPVLTQCPKCNESTFEKKISAAGFRLKGSGWYETDFKTGKKKNLADSASSDKAASTTSTS